MLFGSRVSLQSGPGPCALGRMVPRGRHEAGELVPGHRAGPSSLSPPRYGKRDKEGTLDFLECGSPHSAVPRWVLFCVLCAQMPGAGNGGV